MSARVTVPDEDIRAKILALTAERGAERSICPSEVARTLAPETVWQGLLGPVRAQAVALAREGAIDILRKGKPVDPQTFKGVYRLRIKGAT